MKHHYYTAKQIEFIKENIKGCRFKELTKRFNERFNLQVSHNAIKSVAYRNNFFNAIKEGVPSYRKAPVGAERVWRGDYVMVKITQDKWQKKHILIWEAANGPVPEGHVIIFGDRNKRNFELSNLLPVSRSKLAIMNRNHLIQNDTELTKTGILIAGLKLKMNELKIAFHKRKEE